MQVYLEKGTIEADTRGKKKVDPDERRGRGFTEKKQDRRGGRTKDRALRKAERARCDWR